MANLTFFMKLEIQCPQDGAHLDYCAQITSYCPSAVLQLGVGRALALYSTYGRRNQSSMAVSTALSNCRSPRQICIIWIDYVPWDTYCSFLSVPNLV